MNLDPKPLPALGLDAWQGARANWPAGEPVAVRLPNDTDPGVLRDDLARISAVLLEFPKWTDGRAYSQAWLLRARLGYTGEVRATGDVLVDMAPLLRRTGFDSAVLRPGQSRQAALYALGFFDGHYQRDAVAG
jgi:uncharacterized protein (DUF934 family)